MLPITCASARCPTIAVPPGRPSPTRPGRRTEPLLGSAPASSDTSVDFPAPFGPTTATNSPGSTVRSTSAIASRPEAARYPKLTPRNSRGTGATGLSSAASARAAWSSGSACASHSTRRAASIMKAFVMSSSASTPITITATITIGQAPRSVSANLITASPADAGRRRNSAMWTRPTTVARIVSSISSRMPANRYDTPTTAAAHAGASPAASRATAPDPRPRRRTIPHGPPSSAQPAIITVANAPAARKATNPAATAAAITARSRHRSPTTANGTADSSSITPRWGRNVPTDTMITASAPNTPAFATSAGRRAPGRGSGTICEMTGRTAERVGTLIRSPSAARPGEQTSRRQL